MRGSARSVRQYRAEYAGPLIFIATLTLLARCYNPKRPRPILGLTTVTQYMSRNCSMPIFPSHDSRTLKLERKVQHI